LGHRVLKLSRLASVSKLPVPFLTSLNIPHTNFVVSTCAHPKWQNNWQLTDGGKPWKLQDSVPQHWHPLEHSNPWWFLDRMLMFFLILFYSSSRMVLTGYFLLYICIWYLIHVERR
jgi:hypothetical protein